MTEEKFREIYHQYYRLVNKVIFSVLHDADFSEDVCQEVFLSFLEKADTLDEEYYRKWLLVNAKRKAIDFCRKAYQVHEITAAAPGDEDEEYMGNAEEWMRFRRTNHMEDEVAHKIVLKELADRLLEDLANKNPDWYEIVMRMHIRGENADETARALGISVENLRAKRHRIKLWINEHFREEYEGI